MLGDYIPIVRAIHATLATLVFGLSVIYPLGLVMFSNSISLPGTLRFLRKLSLLSFFMELVTVLFGVLLILGLEGVGYYLSLLLFQAKLVSIVVGFTVGLILTLRLQKVGSIIDPTLPLRSQFTAVVGRQKILLVLSLIHLLAWNLVVSFAGLIFLGVHF